MVLLAEALHTLSDIFISAFLLVVLIWSRRKADALHMFGYGRAQNVAALVAATLFISFTSYKLFEESVPRLFRAELSQYSRLWLALTVILISMVIAVVPLVALLRQKQRGASARAQLMELVNDQLGLFAALVGTLFVWWGWPLGDPIAAMVVATIIAINAVGLSVIISAFCWGGRRDRSFWPWWRRWRDPWKACWTSANCARSTSDPIGCMRKPMGTTALSKSIRQPLHEHDLPSIRAPKIIRRWQSGNARSIRNGSAKSARVDSARWKVR